jgi:hypothetical protein
MGTLQNIQVATTIEYIGRNDTRIYADIKDRQAKHQSHMIKVEVRSIINMFLF